MSTNRSNWLTRTASIFIVSMLLIPLFFGSVRNVQAANITVCASGCDYTTIQEAVTNAPDGSTVEVKAGTYVEQVKITKSLILFTADNAIINPPETILSACSTALINYPLICVEPPNPASSVNVTVDGFTINGMDRAVAGTVDRYFGITYHNAGGVIQNNIITGIKGVVNSNLYRADGIYITETEKNIALNVDILGNTISDFHKNAITLTTQTWPTSLTFLIQSNVITGTPNATVAQNGIQVNAFVSGGIIQGNTIANIAYNNSSNVKKLVAASILSISTPVNTLSNVITGAQAGIVYLNDSDDLGNYREISGNQIEVIKPGSVPNPGENVYGILVTDRSKDVLSPVDLLSLNAVDAELTNALLSVAVTNNTISYVGTLPNAKTFGIEIDAGIGTNPITGPVPGDNILSVDVSGNRIYGATNGFDAGLVIYQCDPADLPIDTVEFCGVGSLDTSRIVGNDITGNNFGVIFDGLIGEFMVDDFHHNRISGNGVGVQNNTPKEILMINNWWGCNAGPGAVGCDTTGNVNPAFSDPWLVLSTVTGPTTVSVGGTSTLTADLKWNSNAENTALSGSFVRDGIPVTFSSATLGSVNPLSGATLSGAAPTTFTAPFVGGTFQACATVDSETVCSDVTVEPPLMIFLPVISR